MEPTASVQQTNEQPLLITATSSAVEALSQPSRIALLVAIIAENCDQWAVVEAVGTILGHPMDITVLDLVVTSGLASLESGRISVPCEDVRRTVLRESPPSECHEAHRALAGALHTDPLASAWHRTHATQSPQAEAAEVAVATARALQRLGRPTEAQEMLTEATRLSTSALSRASRLVEAGATSFARGNPNYARVLLAQAESCGLPPELSDLAELLRDTFMTPLRRPSTRGWVDVARGARILHGWGLSSVSFSVLLAGDGESVPKEVLGGTTPGSAALAALVEMSVGATVSGLPTARAGLLAPGLGGAAWSRNARPRPPGPDRCTNRGSGQRYRRGGRGR